MKRLTGLLAVMVMVLGMGLQPDPANADDSTRGMIQSVIDGQIAAFRVDDGNTAYSFASPSLRQVFTSPENFMAMVRSGYQPVYRPKSVTYGRLREAKGLYVQEVFVVGPDGEPYTALYSLQVQPDGSLKISGCRITRTTGQSA
jgi:hypothetical protein